MPMDKWDACSFPIDEEMLEGRVCYGGLDLSSTTDITAFVLVFPPEDDSDKYSILPYFWLPEETLDLRVKRDHVPYDVWERQGFVQTTEGNVVHYGYIERFIEKLGERFDIREIAFDRWGAVQIEPGGHGLYCRSIWSGLQRYVTSDQGADEADIRIATIMGLDCAIRCGSNTDASVYDDRGILFI